MDLYVLVEGEFRSLVRNALERIIHTKFSKKENKYMEILLKVSTRAVASLTAVFFLNAIKSETWIRENVSYFLIAMFVYFTFVEFQAT